MPLSIGGWLAGWIAASFFLQARASSRAGRTANRRFMAYSWCVVRGAWCVVLREQVWVVFWCRKSEVPVGGRCGRAAARGAMQEPLLDQEGLVHLFERAGILPDGHGDG